MNKIKKWVIAIISVIVYLCLVSTNIFLEIYFPTLKQGYKSQALLFIVISVLLFWVYVVALIIPKKFHNFLYKLSKKIYKNSDLEFVYIEDNYKHFWKRVIGFCVVSYILIIAGLLLSIFSYF